METWQQNGMDKHNLVSAVVNRLAFESPQLSDLTKEQLERIAEVVIMTNLRDDLKRLSELARIDYEKEKAAYLLIASKTGSAYTIKRYSYSISMLEVWASKMRYTLLDLTTGQADDYITQLRAYGYAPKTVRAMITGVGAFYSFLARRFQTVRNPFRGTKALPANRPKNPILIPTSDELELILLRSIPWLRAAIICMSHRGLRIGSLPTLVIEGTRFRGWSKGKEIYGNLPTTVLESISAAHLDCTRPFFGYSLEAMKQRVRQASVKLAKEGKVRGIFSAHDYRHYFAVVEYTRNPDIHQLRRLLQHSQVGTTEEYLRTIKMI